MDEKCIFDQLDDLLKPRGYRIIGLVSRDSESFKTIKAHFPKNLDSIKPSRDGIVRIGWHQDGMYYHANILATLIHNEGSD